MLSAPAGGTTQGGATPGSSKKGRKNSSSGSLSDGGGGRGQRGSRSPSVSSICSSASSADSDFFDFVQEQDKYLDSLAKTSSNGVQGKTPVDESTPKRLNLVTSVGKKPQSSDATPRKENVR